MITNNSSSVAQGEAILVDVAPRETGEQGSASKGIDPNEKHLSTDHLLGDLKGRTISGTFITIAAQAITVPVKPRVHHGAGASAPTKGFRPLCHGHDHHGFSVDVSGCRALYGHSAAAGN